MGKKLHAATENGTDLLTLLGKLTNTTVKGFWTAGMSCGILRRGINFTAPYGLPCCIEISSNPEARWVMTRYVNQEPVKSPPYPEGGEAIKVWQDGAWIKPGPWQQIASDILYEIEAEIRAAKEEAEQKKTAKIKAHEAKKADELKKLQQAWS